MWSAFSLSRPLLWLSLSAFSASIWLPDWPLRLAAAVLVGVGILDAWRVIQAEHRRRQLCEGALNLTEEGAIITDAEHRILAVNPAFTRITGYAPDEVRGQVIANLAAPRHDAAFFERFRQSLQSSGRWEGELWSRRKQGEEYPEWLRVQAIPDATGRDPHHVCLFTDISMHKAREKDLQRIAFEDPLTGLPNRRRLQDLLASRLRHLRAGEMVDMALIDIDGFKEINDGIGVDLGDRLLARFAQRLAGHVAGGVVGRLGGDEFLVIRTTTFNDHDRWVANLRDHLCQPFEIDRHSLRLGLTIGSCRAPEDGQDAGVLFQRLESALYTAKRNGRNHSQRFRPALDVQEGPQLRLLNDLRDALAAGGQLALHYQPQFRLTDDGLAGAEALLRWHHPVDGLVSPGDFIPLAERHGLMAALGNWVIDQALAQLAHWRRRGMPDITVWINISAMQLFQGDLENTLAAGVARHGVPPSALGLELTESVLLDERAGDVAPRLARLRRKGHPVAIDDFGTGYSSLGYLKELPLDKLKLDRAFVRSLPEDRADAAIVTAVMAMARGLGLEVVAEGVESAPQRDFLAAAGCELVQGFFYGRPEVAEALEARWRRADEASPAPSGSRALSQAPT
ncbi:PAS domain S-box-containing protein/diguanylate cyclase (GGDEF) domain-containing protein [Halomonas shengliensis]|uniref:PAS domain S-box-containing protein/diguanylate cyclase (GGDEF) domain-containing protein n=1 Tax=Halomonas shengliensis TaxID=419597 RepID=A0A1H0MTT9_9GAMM|nr:GGDEF domain-containing phosphodiesterase [Halomonas shengliensis]SDO83833.1 PAS domain S-box-containing protein/diguanylate cyclase (GGDEF) domain-containing protein [Halomonas shengliensis]